MLEPQVRAHDYSRLKMGMVFLERTYTVAWEIVGLQNMDNSQIDVRQEVTLQAWGHPPKSPQRAKQHPMLLETSEDGKWFETRIPKGEDFWVHHSGDVYRVMTVTNLTCSDKTKFPTEIVYYNSSGEIFSTHTSRWFRSFRPQELINAQPW